MKHYKVERMAEMGGWVRVDSKITEEAALSEMEYRAQRFPGELYRVVEVVEVEIARKFIKEGGQ